MAGLIKRNGTWHLRMRVPVRYSSVEHRKELHRSLKTGDRKQAEARRAIVEAQILDELDARLAVQGPSDRESRFEAIAKLSSNRGYAYKTAGELAGGPIEDVLGRVTKLIASGDEPGSLASQALLGAVERPRLTLTAVAESMAERFEEEVKYKTPKQRDTWGARWTRPASKLVSFLGYDPVLEELQRQEALSFVGSLKKQVLEGNLKGGSAKKDIQNLNLLWKKYHLSIGVDETEIPRSPFRGLGAGLDRNDTEGRKKEVPIEYINRIVAPGALGALNQDLADIILVLVETGCRQNEVTDIPPDSIFLDHVIPHIWVRHETGDNAREVKNKVTSRPVPLVGVALQAMKRHPSGFPRYRGKGTFSGSANLRLKQLALLPEGVTIGGLRHSFETRLKNAGVHSDDRGELMGHSVRRIRGREHYGDQMSLERRLQFHQLIELQPKNENIHYLDRNQL
ncbi:DUF6538 domain-containing protein [Lutimaribacter marinistellae]|uniref:DUF6538 domain-containing protein n=1 Tax=Lutimaribacter marinistellae TaxID=1820329 RepID=A0ABV7TEP6_9RHOB